MNRVTIHSPASVSNLVCGFDVLGFALERPFDEMRLKLRNDSAINIINKSSYDLPSEPEKNTAGMALISMQRAIGREVGFDLEIVKNIKPGSGIGSSAASAVGAVAAANHLLGNIFDNQQLMEFALDGEFIASGARHADNVAPCLLGGATIVRSSSPLDVVSIPAPDIYVTLLHPQIEIKTSEARALLPEEVSLKDAVKQTGNIAALIASFFLNDFALMARALEDRFAEPYRKNLIPHFDEVKVKSLEAGAIGGGISGSGPSMFMLSKDEDTAKRVEEINCRIYQNSGIDFNSYVSRINPSGAKVVSLSD